MTRLAVRKVIDGGRVKLKLKLVPSGPKVISEGVVKLGRVQVICPACGQQVEAVARDGRVKGYCAVAKQYVDFQVETQRVHISRNPSVEIRAKMSATTKKSWQNPEYRARQNAASKKLWQDPEYRAKQIAVRTGKHATAETKAKISAALKRRHNTERR